MRAGCWLFFNHENVCILFPFFFLLLGERAPMVSQHLEKALAGLGSCDPWQRAVSKIMKQIYEYSNMSSAILPLQYALNLSSIKEFTLMLIQFIFACYGLVTVTGLLKCRVRSRAEISVLIIFMCPLPSILGHIVLIVLSLKGYFTFKKAFVHFSVYFGFWERPFIAMNGYKEAIYSGDKFLVDYFINNRCVCVGCLRLTL